MAKATQVGFVGLKCVRCGERDGVSLSLHDLDTLHCNQCDEEYTLSEVRDTLDQWAVVLAWGGAAPPRQGAAPALRPARAGEVAG
jgi:peptide subunit release factor 1 (eRF1)